jgi:hypothetical protein
MESNLNMMLCIYIEMNTSLISLMTEYNLSDVQIDYEPTKKGYPPAPPVLHLPNLVTFGSANIKG